MRNISIHLNDNNNVSGISRGSPLRSSIRISPPIAPNNDTKANLRTNSSTNVMRSDSEPHSLMQSHTSGVLTNNVLPKNCTDFGNDMFSHPFYDTNNYLSHNMNKMNKYGLTVNQTAMGAPNGCAMNGVGCGQSSSMAAPGFLWFWYRICTLHSQGRDHHYYRLLGLYHGTSGQSHRVSVHSCESLGSQSSHKENYNRNSSSSSSIGSGNSVTIEADITTISAANVYDHNRPSP
ncbi:unnamed protein product [Medioppia subpectinata]|uniref:Uncharacterized protein n=1 Tax=Medioppia subpectinata TaxID=1979941 RepID=A0A7R9KCY7_9ACAR|nr:unnamed protein product [Medioppia subpectinata]CAG2101215.1 unnamed protein product [Medioppia subpectinata]